MAAEKVVTVTLPGGTKVSCREGLAARLAPTSKRSGSKPEKTDESTPKRKPKAKVSRGRVAVDDN